MLLQNDVVLHAHGVLLSIYLVKRSLLLRRDLFALAHVALSEFEAILIQQDFHSPPSLLLPLHSFLAPVVRVRETPVQS